MSFTLRGVPAAGGVAIGSCILYDPSPPLIPQHRIVPNAITTERERLLQAVASSMQEVTQLRDVVQTRLGQEEAAIFDAHLLLLKDEALLAVAYKRIEQDLMNAERALWEATEEFAQIIAAFSDNYFQVGTADMHDIRVRIVSHLQGRSTNDLRHLSTPVIIVAHDLLPSDTAGIDPAYVLGFVTEHGGPTSHTAILARQIGIPAIVAVPGLLSTLHSMDALPACIALDGTAGTVVIDPDIETIARYELNRISYRQYRQKLESLSLLPAITPDGLTVEMATNIGRPQEIQLALETGADGVGLFRTEYLFLDRASPPGEEEQLESILTVLDAFAGKTVIVRTLDVGGDKTIPYLNLERESNPFLGLRGIRLCLSEAHLPLFRSQLRALLRATAESAASLWVMLPMVSDIGELRQTRALLVELEAALLQEGKLQAPVLAQLHLGVMIETPAAALLMDILAKEADFFSIGTNDLTQYTLASDRINASLADLHRPFHPALMRSVAHIVTSAHKFQRWVGVCGEIAGNPRATPFLVGLGTDGISTEPNLVNGVKQVIRSTPKSWASELVQRILQAETAEVVEELLAELHR